MITETGMRDLTVGQRLRRVSDGRLFVLTFDPRNTKVEGALFQAVGEASARNEAREVTNQTYDTFRSVFRLAEPIERISEGFYHHRAADLQSVYYVFSVGILDEDGHGDETAPRQVVYRGTRPHRQSNIRSECEFGQLVTWPDGIVRPRFVRMGYPK